MNNAKLIENVLEEEIVDITPAVRERGEKLVELIEALNNISQSSYWQVIQRAFDNDLTNLISRLEKEKDTVEIFRLQGEIKSLKKVDLVKNLQDCRQELERLKIKLNEPNY